MHQGGSRLKGLLRYYPGLALLGQWQYRGVAVCPCCLLSGGVRAVPRCKALLKFRLNRGSQRQVHKACSELELVLAQYMNRERQGTLL